MGETALKTSLKKSTQTIVALLFTFGSCLGQNFSLREDFPSTGAANSAYSCEFFAGELVSFHGGLDSTGQHVGLLRHSLEGEYISTLDFFAENTVQILGGPDCSSTNQSGSEIAVVFAEDSIGDNLLTYKSRILVLNDSFEVIKSWENEPDTILTFLTQVIHLSEGGYQAIGWTEETENDTRGAIVMRFNEQLEVEWETILPGEIGPFGDETALSGNNMVELENSHSFISCSNLYLSEFDECTDSWYKVNPMFIELDNEGNELSREEWHDCYSTPEATLLKHSNGNVYVAHTRQNPETSTNEVNWLNIFVTCFNSDFDVLWEQQYGEATISAWCHKIEEKANGDLIVGGYTYGPQTFGEFGFALNLSNQGDSLWMRYYRQEENTQTRINDLILLNDSCYVGCGRAFPNEQAESLDSWLFKMGPDGCIENGCDISVTEFTGYSIDFFPNPCDNYLKVSGHLPPVRNLNISLISSDGREFSLKEIAFNHNSLNLDLREFSPGIYLLVLDSPEYRISEKIIIR